MIDTTVEFNEFVKRLQDKFGYTKKVRCKVRDEDGDGMIGLADQEDLDMVICAAKKSAKRERSDTGKMEVSAKLLRAVLPLLATNRVVSRFGWLKYNPCMDRSPWVKHQQAVEPPVCFRNTYSELPGLYIDFLCTSCSPTISYTYRCGLL